MKNVDITKACGHDGVGNKIIQLCCEGFCEFFTNFINLSFDLGKFPFQWKLANVIPLFGSGFRPGNSTINQLIYIIHQIYLAFESGKEVRVVFLDISKAFDKVWHAGLLKKLEALGVRDPLLSWIESYLFNRKQRVVVEGQSSEWANINAGVPQGSVLGPLVFLIYINDLTDKLISNPFIYADDTMLFEVVENADVSAANLNDDLNRISHWSSKWLVTMNPSKCRSLVFSLKRSSQTSSPFFIFE